jgi:DNA primase
MTLQELKQAVRISEYLGVEEKEKEFFIHSPFREEKTPSFKINPLKNTWYDFGIGEGGTIIDLIAMLENVSIKEAVNRLRKLAKDTTAEKITPYNTLTKAISHEQERKGVNILTITKLQNNALISYLTERKINIEIAKYYIRELHYQINNKRYFGIAFKNDSDGYEIRNKYFKGAIGKKNITTIAGEKRKEVIIFEGFIDFLSYLTLKAHIPKKDFIVLNSVGLIKKIPHLHNYKTISLALDNDDAGTKATKYIQELYPYAQDVRRYYKNYKDLNEFLISRHISYF